jgi:hypothetical protein
MSTFNEAFKAMQSDKDAVTDELKKLNKKMSCVDLSIVYYHHFLEFGNLPDDMILKIHKSLKKALQKRREIKDQLDMLKIINDKLNGERKYMPRTLVKQFIELKEYLPSIWFDGLQALDIQDDEQETDD